MASITGAPTHRLNWHSYQARWEARRTGPEIRLEYCPYAAILPQHAELCQIDCLLLEELLKARATSLDCYDPAKGIPVACTFALQFTVPNLSFITGFKVFEKKSTLLNRYQADGVLLMTTIIWGAGFTAQRIAAQNLGPFMINGIRFILAALFLLPFTRFRPKIAKSNLPGVILAGAFLTMASNLQQLGLFYTTAGNAGFITGLYVIFVPFFLWVFWHEAVRWTTFLAAGIAVVGMLFINTGGVLHFASGDLYELAGAVFWALHLIIIGIMVRKMDVLAFSVGQFAICGIVNLILGFFFEPFRISNIWQSGWALLYAGIISGGVGYTLQALGQKSSPASDAALILSLEAVFAALFGFLLLKESASSTQLFGYVLILTAIVLAQILRPVSTDQQEVSSSPQSN